MTTHTRIVNYTVELFDLSAADESDPDPLMTESADDPYSLMADVMNFLNLSPHDEPAMEMILDDPDTKSISYRVMSGNVHVATAVMYVNG